MIKIAADEGYEFAEWTGDASGATAEYTFSDVTSNKNVTANFFETAVGACSEASGVSGGLLTYNGHDYETVEIGDQCWMAENMESESYSSGESICADWLLEDCDPYGRLYNFDAANDICPSGWHLPSNEEWQEMEMELGMSAAEANAMYDGSPADIKWSGSIAEIMKAESPDWNGTNASGFNALPGGYVFNMGAGNYQANHVEERAYFWTSTQDSDFMDLPWHRVLDDHESGVGRQIDPDPEDIHFSVRCVAD